MRHLAVAVALALREEMHQVQILLETAAMVRHQAFLVQA
jgi:hypothetical protein